ADSMDSRRGGMPRLAEAGATTHMLMAVSGHNTLSEVQRYTDDADRKKLAEQATALKGRARATNLQTYGPNLANLPLNADKIDVWERGGAAPPDLHLVPCG